MDRRTVLRVLDAYFRMRHIPWRRNLEKRGQRWGRPSRVDEATRAKAAKMRTEGKSIREIARDLRVPKSTIARALAANVCAP